MKKFYAICLCAMLCITATGCSHFSGNSASGSNVTYSYKNEQITLPASPKKVITLSTPLLNMTYAIGGSSIARPTTSNPIPEAAKELPELGQVSHINMETLVGLKPDLVLGEKGQNTKFESLLQSNKIPYLLINYDGINDNVPLLKLLGQIFNKKENADKIIKEYEDGVSKAKKESSQFPPARVAVLRATGKSVTAETPKAICASMVEQLHMENVLLNHKDVTLDTKTVPYSLEQLSSDNPEIIFVVTMGKDKDISQKMDEQMRDNPAWSNLDAVKNGRVYFLPSDLFLLNPGIRTPEAMNKLLDLAYRQ